MVRASRILACSCSLLGLLVVPQTGAEIVPRRYTVNLDEDPAHRWDHVAAAEKDVFVKNLRAMYADDDIKDIVPVAKTVLGNLLMSSRIFPAEIYQEMKGVARVTGLEFSEIAVLGMFYDLWAAKKSPLQEKACSGIVAQTKEGEIWHGRNLDFDFRNELQAITIVVDFQSKNVTKFTSVNLGPNPNVNTGVKYGAFSLSQNERDTGSITDNIFDLLVRGRTAMMSAVRMALQSDEITNYDEAIKHFSEIKMSAAAYFVIGGTKAGEGGVVTRGRSQLVDVWSLNLTAGRWYVIETNYDHTVTPPWGDNRRAVEIRAMDKMGQGNITSDGIWDVLSIRRVKTADGERAPRNSATVYTTIMQASNPKSFKTMIRATASQEQAATLVV